MKSIGIVRRIDDLGRVVIPKEIRKSLRLLENDMIEIYIENDSIILKKYSLLENMIQNVDKILNTGTNLYKCEMFLCDSSTILLYSGKNKDKFIGKTISDFLLKQFKTRKKVVVDEITALKLSNDTDSIIDTKYIMFPLIVSGDIYGIFGILYSDRLDKYDEIGNIFQNLIQAEIEL